VTTSNGGVYEPPPPPPNGGTTREYLQRIEAKADDAAVQASKAMSATLRLERALLGDYGNPGRIGTLEKKFDDFVDATEKRETEHWDQSRFRISNRLAALGVIVVALVGVASVIVALVK
jgi:hypothetical protein